MDALERRERALRAVALSRRHRRPLSETAQQVGLSPESVLEEVGEAFEPHGNDWRATLRDQIPREMSVLTDDGPERIVTRDSGLASRLGRQNNAVRHNLETGNPSRLRPMTLRVGDRVIRLASDPETIDRLAEGGEIHLEVYRR